MQVWTTEDSKSHDQAHEVTLERQCPKDPAERPLHLQLALGEALGKCISRAASDNGPRAGLSLAPSLPCIPPEENHRSLTHSAADTKQFRCPSFSSRTSLVRASPVDCSPMTIHCKTHKRQHTRCQSSSTAGNSSRLKRLFPIPGTFPLNPAPNTCWGS